MPQAEAVAAIEAAERERRLDAGEEEDQVSGEYITWRYDNRKEEDARAAAAAAAAKAAAPTGEQTFGSLFGTITAVTDNLKDIWTHANNEFFFALAIIILGVIAVNLFNQFGNYSNMLTRKEEGLFDKLKKKVRGLFD